MENNNNIGKNMCLVKAIWQNKETFKLIPVLDSCPYNEVVYDPLLSLLYVIGNKEKQQFQYVPKLDGNGNKVKSTKQKENGVWYKEERVLVGLLSEYHIIDKKEQEKFVEMFAVNSGEFDFRYFLNKEEPKEMGSSNEELILPSNIIIK